MCRVPSNLYEMPSINLWFTFTLKKNLIHIWILKVKLRIFIYSLHPGKGMERVIFLSLFVFSFIITYQKYLYNIQYNKTLNCPWFFDFIYYFFFNSVSVCDMSYLILLIPRSNTRLTHASRTRKLSIPFCIQIQKL